MAALVQSFPSPSTSTMTMLQTRPSSSEAFQSGSQGQQHQRNTQMPRNIYNTSVGGMAAGNYRGHTANTPVAPYAFTGTPILQNGANPLRQHPTAMPPPRLENRTASAPSIPVLQQATSQGAGASSRPRPPAANAVFAPVTLPNFNINSPALQGTTKDDPSKQSSSKSFSTFDLNPPTLQTASYAHVAKSSPDRYRRNHRRAETSGALTTSTPIQGGSAKPSGSGMATVGHLYTHPTQTSSTPTLSTYPSYRGAQSPSPQPTNDFNPNAQPTLASKDDLNLQKQSSSELAKRYRRRSISSLEAKEYAIPLSEAPAQTAGQPKTYAAMLAGPAPSADRKETRPPSTNERPTSAHGRNGSNESSTSGRSSSRPSSVRC